MIAVGFLCMSLPRLFIFILPCLRWQVLAAERMQCLRWMSKDAHRFIMR